jgi:hypothetical protein
LCWSILGKCRCVRLPLTCTQYSVVGYEQRNGNRNGNGNRSRRQKSIMEKINEANTTSPAPTLPARSVNAPAPQVHDDATRPFPSFPMPIQCSSLAEPAPQTHSKSIGLIPGYTHTHTPHGEHSDASRRAAIAHGASHICERHHHHRHSFPWDILRYLILILKPGLEARLSAGLTLPWLSLSHRHAIWTPRQPSDLPSHLVRSRCINTSK